MKKIIITLCLIIIFSVIFSYNSYENFISIEKRYKPQYVGPILFYDYNDNNIGSYPDDKIWPNFFKKVDNKYINLLGAGKPFEIKFPKSNKGNIGPKGYKGLVGDIGPKGQKGENITGPKGPDGTKGPRGNKGPTGGCNVCEIGDKGETGNKGEVGDKGAMGPKGERPLKNEAETGNKGEVGDMGPTGTLRGLEGPQGPKGEDGDKGLPGDVMAVQGQPGRLEKNVRDDYLQINRPEIDSPNEIEIGNPNTYIEIDTDNVFIKNNLCIKKNGIEKCINKDDISKLYKLNNPTCTCPHGEIVDIDKCTFSGIACRSCDPGYYKANEIINGEFQKNIQTTICKACNKQCGSNKYLDSCGGDNPGECKQCPGCPPGQHRVGCEGTIIGTCVQNTCSCSNGTKATGAACTSNGANICTSCQGGFHKSGNNCVQNSCSCDGGIGATGSACTSNGANICTSCYDGYYKSGNNCQQKRSCPPNQHGAPGVRSEGNDTTDRTCKSWREYAWSNPYFEDHSKRDGKYKHSYILSWDGSNLWSYVVWNTRVYWYKWLGNQNSTNQIETGWMPWPGGAKERETKFKAVSKERGGDDFRCEKHYRAANYPNSNFDNRNPVADNNGVCDGSWSSNNTNYYSIKYKDRFWE